ncbi:cytosine deaminase [Microbacterium endophyticum]|uniref:Cytosine deaminase n=1 Tax=Microbacterium endophyticum TaxID=1526412 RepID=A0A7W4V2J5_9MICO|nr:amidohydrolase family protein [Microbacterium endophyticum]MBB2975673.1 cytosine deaminase [Microbacterium endophyticum]NIK35308.1 cytosine deaminase [Microbacterium endophyticum]
MPLIRPEHLVPHQNVNAVSGATTIDGASSTFAIVDGRIADRNAGHTEVSIDAAGWMVLSPLADLHAHLDKAYTWSASGSPAGSLEDAVASWRAFSPSLSYDDIKTNARRQLTAAFQSGVTAMRTHVNYHEGDDSLRGIRAVVELRAEFRNVLDLQVVAMHDHTRSAELIRSAIALGVDLLGAAPHLAPDPQLELERTLRLAEEANLGVDLHTDENLNPDSLGLLELARLTKTWPKERTRSAGHCVSLAMQDPETLALVLKEAATADVSIITNPLTNLYLQGWQHPVATPRALPPLAAILAAGVTLAAGGDNVQDPFNPLGNGDMIDVVAAMVLAGHLSPRAAWDIAAAGRSLMGLQPATGAVGDAADMILVRAASVAEAVAERAPDRVVIRAGRVISVQSRSSRAVTVTPLAQPENSV